MALRRDDLLSDFVIHEVPTDVRATMSEDQIKAVRNAATKRHSVDIRFTLPLLFTQLYFVLLIGRDTRNETVESNRERRTQAGFHASYVAIGIGAAIAVIATAIVLYVLKSKAGINLFPGHAHDFIPIGR
jgi:hypothetical protein